MGIEDTGIRPQGSAQFSEPLQTRDFALRQEHAIVVEGKVLEEGPDHSASDAALRTAEATIDLCIVKQAELIRRVEDYFQATGLERMKSEGWLVGYTGTMMQGDMAVSQTKISRLYEAADDLRSIVAQKRAAGVSDEELTSNIIDFTQRLTTLQLRIENYVKDIEAGVPHIQAYIKNVGRDGYKYVGDR